MNKIYIVRGECLVEDEEGFENIGAYTTLEKAESCIKALVEEDGDVEYYIETLDVE